MIKTDQVADADIKPQSGFYEKISREDPDKQKKYTVFLVEDNVDDRDLTVNVLKRSPYIHNIHCFESGNKLLQYLAGQGYYSGGLVPHLPSIILLDIHMPEVNGMEILEELKDHPLTEDIPVIIVTNDVSLEKASEARKLHANAFIAKPIHLDHIHEVIHTGWGWPKKKESDKESD
jgi:CheY-like chemotaxis protein